MNRSFRAEELGLRQLKNQQMGSLRNPIMKEKEEELALFFEMRRREKESNDLLLLQNGDAFDEAKAGDSAIFNIGSATNIKKYGADDFLNADNDKNDYEWLLTPPSTPLFPSLEMESQKSAMKLGTANARSTASKSRLANPEPDHSGRSNLASRQPAPALGLNSSSSGLRRPSSSGGSRPSTPTGRPTLSATSASRRSSSATSRATTSSTAASKTITATSRPSRSSTPTSRATLPSTKSVAPPRSSTPTSRSTARSLTPTTRASVPGSKPTSRAATPTRRPTSVSSTASATAHPVKSPSSVTTTVRNPGASRPSSPTVKPRPWKPSDMPGFSYVAPPNLRTSLSDRPTSATRGRPGAPSARSSSIEPATNGRIRRQSCSPSRGRPPNGVARSSGSSVPIPAMSRLHAKANDNVSPVMMGTKMVERVVNMRKLAPPSKQDNKHSPHSNVSANTSSPDSTGFGRTLSKKSLDMAMRHMDIRRSIPGNLRPLMANIPASSMYSVRSGTNRSRTLSVSDSPLAASSNASSEVSVNNNALCVDGSVDDDISSDKVARSPAGMYGR